MAGEVKTDSRSIRAVRATATAGAIAGAMALVVVLVAGCAGPAERGADAPAAVPAGSAAPPSSVAAVPRGARHYDIDAARSLLTIRVLRGGTLASVGHNHVIASHDLQGSIERAPALQDSLVQLRFPVAALTVDEPALRTQAGADFAAEVPDSARDGTRRNLFGPALLDAARFGAIELRASRIVAEPGGARMTMRVRVREVESEFEAPVAITTEGADLVASGEVELRQSQLGLTPFSVMMGALQVQDAMRLQFRVVARP